MNFTIRIARSARFTAPGFTRQQMHDLGGVIEKETRDRLRAGQNLQDAPAKPLTKRYARYKQRVQRQTTTPLRNLRLTGKTLANLQVVSATEKQVVVGFTNPQVAQRVAFQSRYEQVFGMSRRTATTVLAKANSLLAENVGKLAVAVPVK